MKNRYTLALLQHKKDQRRTTTEAPDVQISFTSLREILGVSATQMANDLGISRSYLSMIEAGKRTLTPDLEQAFSATFLRYLQRIPTV